VTEESKTAIRYSISYASEQLLDRYHKTKRFWSVGGRCDKCGEEFSTKKAVKKHKATIHSY